MIPDQQLQRTKTIEIGKTYFRVGHPDDGYEIFTAMSEDQTTVWPDSSYYGPIDTTPSVIDLSHFDLSKIEAKTQPDKPGLWTGFNVDGIRICLYVSNELLAKNHGFTGNDWRFLCDFIPPKQSPVIPPLPTVTLYAVEQLGVVKWCHKSISGFWTADGLQAFGDPDAVPIAEKVVTVTE